MNVKPFLDTNVVLYAFTNGDPRSAKADALVAAGGIVSVQVLNEFVHVSRRKLRRAWGEIEEALAVLKTLLEPPLPLTMDMHETALAIARDYKIAFYDSLIVAAACRSGCRVLYSEDMQDGRELDGVTIRNPFA